MAAISAIINGVNLSMVSTMWQKKTGGSNVSLRRSNDVFRISSYGVMA